MRKEVMEQWRTYRMLVVGAVLVLFGFASPVMARYMPELMATMPGGEAFAEMIPTPSASDAVEQYVNNLSQFGVILAVFLGMGAVAMEKSRGTAAMILVKPHPRWAFLGAKLAALGLTFAAAIGLAALGGYFYTWILFEPLNAGGWLALNALLMLYMLVHLSIALLGSTLARSQGAAAGMAVVGILLLSIVRIIPAVSRVMPSVLLGWGAMLSLGLPIEPAWGAVLVNLGLVAGLFAAAWWSLVRQEM
jgi:ABC-2 type transport system permease protein